MLSRLLPAVLALAGLLTPLAAVPSADGLYATFDVSWGNPVQQGTFTARLEYALAPRTVANFVTLAEGTRAWLDEATGEVKRTPYYDGLTFHRVVSGFVIQGGSPKGDGTDGPGYAFIDEFNANLRHSGAGILSMANSGANTNGSQFFVTLAATAWLNDVHSVFGSVVENLSVVQSIGTTPVSSTTTGRPVSTVRINKVTIHRVGAAAQAWNPLAQPLPVVKGTGGSLAIDGTGPRYVVTPQPRSVTRLWAGPQLKSLASDGAIFDHDPTYLDSLALAPSVLQEQAFFARMVRVEYPEELRNPAKLRGHRYVVNVAGTIFTLNFTTDTAGTWSVSDTSGSRSGNLQVLLHNVDPNRPYSARFGCRLLNFFPTLTPPDEDFYFDPFFGGVHEGRMIFYYRDYGQAGSPFVSFNATFTMSRP